MLVSAELGVEVLLAGDALTTSNLLFTERNPPLSLDNPPAQGRIMERPIQFRLITSGADCIPVDTRDHSRTLLDDSGRAPD